ncbi:MAG TPA: ATP-dependent DNA ligase [Puia sp.]|jgi:DNA ligase-1|nr:ATP-dependent DNA ligase [Puia sp.]
MNRFAILVQTLGAATKTNIKLEALVEYFEQADERDKVWVIAIFSGRKPKRIISSADLISYGLEITALPLWLFEECYHTVGDLAETLSLLIPAGKGTKAGLQLNYYLNKLILLQKSEEPEKKNFILDSWKELTKNEMFVFNKLITGNFRIGVSQKMIVNALARSTKNDPSVIAHRITGNWDPMTFPFSELTSKKSGLLDYSKPYPFYLAYALDEDLNSLGSPDEWFAEWKWDGIRGEIILRNSNLFVWSRGEELMTEKFPEFSPLQSLLPDGTVLDGEIICLSPSGSDSIDFLPLPFAALQTRIGRKTITRKNLAEAPVGFIAYDLLEYLGQDFREKTQLERRIQLEKIISEIHLPVLRISPLIPFQKWDELIVIRQKSRELGSEGLMLKRKNAPYQTGRKRGDWWKWKIDPLVIDAVMVYAQKGHGRRSNLYTDFTFAVRKGNQLVTFTKAYSGLTDKEFNEVDYFVKKNSLEKFGPVRTVKPELVFEIAFEGIAESKRHKSGVALRFPRISRWRKDKKPEEINTLDDLQMMLKQYGKH